VGLPLAVLAEVTPQHCADSGDTHGEPNDDRRQCDLSDNHSDSPPWHGLEATALAWSRTLKAD
jgi:hypothetical protein